MLLYADRVLNFNRLPYICGAGVPTVLDGLANSHSILMEEALA